MFRKSLFVELDPVPKICDANRYGELTKKFQRYRPINDPVLLIFVFGSIIMGKEPLAELKFAIFKNWFDTRPKMETHEPRVYPTILGGDSQSFWSPSI